MRHEIIVKFVPEVKNTGYGSLLEEIGSLFRPCTEIPGIKNVQLFPNQVNRPNRFDLMIEITMDPGALEAWDQSDLHQQWKSRYGSIIDRKTIIDLP